MSLLKDINEFSQYVSVPGTLPIDKIKPAIPEAQEKFIRPILGDELLTDLETWYALEDRPNLASFNALLPHVQRTLARFTLWVISPEIDVTISSQGIAVISSSNLVPASSDRVRKFDASNEQRGWDNVETLIRFLEENADDYPEWVASPAYTLAIRNLVNTVSEFNEIMPINNSRLIFNQYRSVMDDADLLKIQPVISIALFNRILTEIKATVSAPVAKILPFLKRAEVYFAAADRLDRSKYEGIGVQVNLAFMQRDIDSFTAKANAYLSTVLSIMKQSIADYPEYQNSGLYETVDTSFENKKENTIYVF